MNKDWKLVKQEKSINELKGILVIDNKTNDEICLIEVDQLIQFYTGNDGLSVYDVNVILDITRNFHLIFESLS
jgi:hypothetical protein